MVPLLIGLGLYLLIDLLITREVFDNELLLRYLTGHPISRITTFMFCVGIAALLLIANNVFDQFCICKRITLPETEGDSQVSQTADKLLDELEQLRRSWHSHYLWQRLRGAIQFINRTSGTAGIEDELKYLADLDHEWQQRRYSLVRIVIWATPMLGFLGTVLGISQALGGIQVGPDNDFQQMLNSLRGSLFVAFDTTALALTLSILLMFFQFFVDRFEVKLLELVDQRTHEELSPFYQHNEFIDPQTRAVEGIGRAVMASSRDLVVQQTEVWRDSMRQAEAAWTGTFADVRDQIHNGFAETMRNAVQELSDSLKRSVEQSDQALARRWEQWQVTLSENARQLNQQQQNMLAQTELVRQLLDKIESTDHVQRSLNQNLDALAATSRLHTTLDRLSESIRLWQHESEAGDPATQAKSTLVRYVDKETVETEPRFEPANIASRKAA